MGATVDCNLSFDNHITDLCRKTNQKIQALPKVGSYMTFYKKRILSKRFITSHFNYCPLVKICHNRVLNNRINHLHEPALIIEYQDKKSDFKTLLENKKSVIIHVKNLRYLATEICKFKNDISSDIMKNIFIIRKIIRR